MTRYKVFWGVMITLAVIWAWWPSEPSSTTTRVKLFCAYGKVFIEFEEKYNTWGTMWLDDHGNTVNCSDDAEQERTSSKIII